MNIGSQTINDFLARLGSSDPTPGGGALAALVGSTAGAMLAMTYNFTIGRPRYADVEAEAQALLTEALDLQQQLLNLADADADAYGGVRDAYGLPRATDEDKAARAAAIEASMHVATTVPVRTAEASQRLLAQCADAARITNVNTLGDVAVAAHIAAGATRAAADQARLNLSSLQDQTFVTEMRARLAAALAHIDELVATTVATVDARTSRP